MTVESTTTGMSQYEVAAQLGISRARVSQIERKALQKLRDLLAQQGYVKGDFYDASSTTDRLALHEDPLYALLASRVQTARGPNVRGKKTRPVSVSR